MISEQTKGIIVIIILFKYISLCRIFTLEVLCNDHAKAYL